jgi:conjugal transfer mating pair stabilization protein TraN
VRDDIGGAELHAHHCRRGRAAERQLCKTWDFIGDPLGGGGYLTCLEPAAPEEVYSCSANVAGMVPESAVSKWFTQIWTDNACSVDLGTCTLPPRPAPRPMKRG